MELGGPRAYRRRTAYSPVARVRSVRGTLICRLMATVALSSELSHAGVTYLAASPETMLAPGVPTDVAHDIAIDLIGPAAMAEGGTDTTMDKTYGPRNGGFPPAAAFDVVDLDPKKTAAVASAIKALDATLTSAAADRT